MDTLFQYAYNKIYHVDFKYMGYEKTITGLLLNYNGGDIVLINEEGIWHIKNKNILFMCPVSWSFLKAQEGTEYEKIVRNYLEAVVC